ncbi:hypothetical protein [Croceimicrobium sp.]|uniref:hypothetical protein n=1 Tax=Croceimicrobium sp. TaxID=2828340 RepID=UPI003BA9597A
MKDLFLSKGFWIAILTFSILGAIASLLITAFKEEPVIKDYGYLCPQNPDFKKVVPAITNPNDSVALYDFERLMSSLSDRARFNGLLIPIGSKVGLLDHDSSKALIKIIRLDNGKTAWLREIDIQSKACDSTEP